MANINEMTHLQIADYLSPLIKQAADAYMSERDITQKQFVDSIGISRSMWTKLKGNSGYGTVLKILHATQGLDLMTLIERSSVPEKQSPGLRDFLRRPLSLRVTSSEKIALLVLDILGVLETRSADDIEVLWRKIALRKELFEK